MSSVELLQTSKEPRDQAFFGLMTVVHSEERKMMAAFYEADAGAARKTISETARVLMAAKSIRVVADDLDFFEECKELVSMSFIHKDVRATFKLAAKADLSTAGDQLVSKDMSAIVEERIERVLECLG